MKMKIELILIGMLMLVAFAGISYAYGFDNQESSYEYSWTTAICSGNSCQDFLIVCNDKEVVDTQPLTGLVTFSDGWEDPRGEDEKRLC